MNDDVSSRPSASHDPIDVTDDIVGYNAQSRPDSLPYPTVRAVRIPAGKSNRASWDAFAHRCEASFRCAYDALTVCQRTGKLTFRPILFDILSADGRQKIGQCGITKKYKNQYSIEALQILPEHEALWEPAMAAVLRELGPARYHYGSHWSIEPPREAALRRVPGVVIKDVTHVIIEAIDFSQWESWDHYLRQISNNVRRNAARAAREKPDLRIRVRCRLATLLDFIKVVRLQMSMWNRKHLNASMAAFGARLLLRTLSLRHHAVSAVAIDLGRLLATYSGIEFGPNSYYLNGSSEPDNGGAAWCLLLHVIKQAYTRTNGAGKFFMGSVRVNDPGWTGLHRSRLHLRVNDYTTSLISFSYQPRP